MFIEHLEARVVLAGVSVHSGLLTITGSAAKDSVFIDQTPSGISLNFNGHPFTFLLAKVKQISISTGSGDDIVALTDHVTRPATINGGSGNDSLRGGGAKDSILGGVGNDSIDGGAGADSMSGRAGNDTLDYSSRTQPVVVMLGTTATVGQASEGDKATGDFENVIGGSGDDVLIGSSADNRLIGNGGSDVLAGNGGNDTLDGGTGPDLMLGGSGTDTVDYSTRSANLFIDLSVPGGDGEAGENDSISADVENVIGGAGNDSITGNAANNSLLGGNGNDTLSGNAGNDTIDGGFGNDSMSGGDGLDTVTYASRTTPIFINLSGQSTGNAVDLNGESDSISKDFETVIGGSGDDSIQNNAPFAVLPNLLIEGGPGDDRLSGSFGDDTVLGGPGDDTLYHTHGNDVLDGDSGKDTVLLSDPFATGGASATLDNVANDGYAGESQNFLNISNVIGGDGDDTIIGNGQDNFLSGGAGANNYVDGGAGNDVLTVDTDGPIRGGGTLIGGAGDDRISCPLAGDVREMHGGPGNDSLLPNGSIETITGDAGLDYVSFGNILGSGITLDNSVALFETILGSIGNDHFIGSDEDEVFLGETGNDTIEGNGGRDYIDGGYGFDSLSGGTGDDVFVNAADTVGGGDADTIDGGPGIDFAQEGGSQGVPGHQSPIDEIDNVEFIYDPTSSPPALAGINPFVANSIVTPAGSSTIPQGGSIEDGVLMISGGTNSSADSISIILDSTGTKLDVTQNSTSKVYALDSVRGISIDSGGGNDNIALARADGSRAVNLPATLASGGGNDTVTGGASDDVLSGGDGSDSIRGGNGDDSITGGTGNDTLNGDAGNDDLNGGVETYGVNSDGADVISGGSGDSDSVIYSYRTDDLNIDISVSNKSNDGASGEGDSVNSDVENVFSGDGDDSIVGNSAGNVISGGGGDDTVHAGAGNDKLIGSRGADQLFGESDHNLYSIADGTRDDYDGGTDAFVSGDRGLDYSTVTRDFLS